MDDEDTLAGKTPEEIRSELEEARIADEAARDEVPDEAAVDEAAVDEAAVDEEYTETPYEEELAELEPTGPAVILTPGREVAAAGADEVKLKRGKGDQLSVVLTVQSSVEAQLSFGGKRFTAEVEGRKLAISAQGKSIDEFGAGLAELRRFTVKVLQPFGSVPAARLARLAKVKVGPDKPLRWEAALHPGDVKRARVQFIEIIDFNDPDDDGVRIAVPASPEQ